MSCSGLCCRGMGYLSPWDRPQSLPLALGVDSPPRLPLVSKHPHQLRQLHQLHQLSPLQLHPSHILQRYVINDARSVSQLCCANIIVQRGALF